MRTTLWYNQLEDEPVYREIGHGACDFFLSSEKIMAFTLCCIISRESTRQGRPSDSRLYLSQCQYDVNLDSDGGFHTG